MPQQALHDRNVVLVTLDSCRFDTAAAAARTPNLNRIGPLLKAETAGTYTLPAHTALFSGSLARALDRPHQLGRDQFTSVWRPAAARRTDSSVAIQLDGATLMDNYRRRGFRVIGAGGVTFFDPDEPHNAFPRMFDEFHYFGRRNRSAVSSRIVDRDETLTLSHVDALAAACARSARFFLFVNCPSTHIPYTTPRHRLDDRLAGLLDRLYDLHDSKRVEPSAFTSDERGLLLTAQADALEWADAQLGMLFDHLVDREPLVVVCADHGEEFGEEGRFGHGHAASSVLSVPLWSGLLGDRP